MVGLEQVKGDGAGDGDGDGDGDGYKDRAKVRGGIAPSCSRRLAS